MINMCIISGNDRAKKATKLLKHINELKVIGLSAGHSRLSENMRSPLDDELATSSEAIYFDQYNPSFDLIKKAIQRSNHLFFSSIPSFTESELKQLINLSAEAESRTQIFIPQIFSSVNLNQIKRSHSPFLANIRVALKPEVEEEKTLEHILLFLTFLDHSELRKVETMTIPGQDGYSVIEIRLAFTSGSVARILLSNQIEDTNCGIEIFRQGSVVLKFQSENFEPKQLVEAEKNAVEHFIQSIRKNNSYCVGLQHLDQACQILRILKLRINDNGNFFSEKRQAV
ncbi:hypothetical protein [Mangrovibacterium sp.]|uniref:hypothetical protein n=1 Tax=Mangrovibacterium sp. TaxID=1961364 RepID=UPI003561CF78